MSFSRSSGILLHPTSLPGPFGIGDLGPEAYAFADFLAESGQSLWQVLPLGPTGMGGSPYASYSAFGGTTLLISPEMLARDGLLTPDCLYGAPAFAERADFELVQTFKDALLRRAFTKFTETSNSELNQDFERFCLEQAGWLDDYALFRALKDANGGRPWNQWDAPLVRREPAALAGARQTLRAEVGAQKFSQFFFFKQWSALKSYCNRLDIRIVGDIPIFVAHDSADVWTRPAEFELGADGRPLVVAGVPPDYFSATGQVWGNPIYNWERMQADGFRFWIDRVRATLQMVDILRVDHFRGFAACWQIPAEDTTAERGRWVASPGRELFNSIRNALGELPIIAEDLGVITPDVESLRDDFGFPGMRVLQFAFGAGDPKNAHLPHNYRRDVVVYTGTHDNDTTVGWFKSEAGNDSTRSSEEIERERKFCLNYLDSNGEQINWDFIRAVFASVADTAIVPLQDVLGLGTEARMNVPNSASGNWAWRFRPGALTAEIGARLKKLSALYGRS
jgi:4-alpha-glucanotransferase